VTARDLVGDFDIVQLQAARLTTRRALLQSVLFELALPYRDLSEGELRLSILDRLIPSESTSPNGLLLIVDEAHLLPAKLLEELRLLTNFTRNNQPRARLVLLGNLRLEETFADPQMESFNQRLAARCYLQPMNRQQTRDYVIHQLQTAGVAPQQLITNDGLDTVYAACEGVPRLANQIMDHSLVLSVTRKQCPISSALIEEAWADLQQLPAPWHSGTDAYGLQSNHSQEVEFSTLNDDEDDFDRPANVGEDAGELHDLPIEFDAEQPRNLFTGFSESDDDAIDSDLYDTENDLIPETTATKSVVSLENYFQERPTDERLLALEDEQAEYDAMGVWENDPPLSLIGVQTQTELEENWDSASSVEAYEVPSVTNAEQAQGKQAKTQLPSEPTNEYLFGDDFDQEESIHVTDVCATQAARTCDESASVLSCTGTPGVADIEQEHPVSDKPTELEAQEYVARIQEFADAMYAQVDNDGQHATVESVLAGMQTQTNEVSESDQNTPPEQWSLDITSLDTKSEVDVQREIEDLVSQLNFSAFSVEPYSVEQIVLDEASNRAAPPQDSIRSGENEEVYMLHRPQQLAEETLFGEAQASYDDDRDLLLIEEELPPGVSNAGQDNQEKAPMKIAPYGQLFSKLRK
jgi:hypothetical protein